MTALTLPPRRSALEILAAPFRAVGAFVLLLTEARARMEQVERLTRMSDADLAARGTTRQAMIARIFGTAAAL